MRPGARDLVGTASAGLFDNRRALTNPDPKLQHPVVKQDLILVPGLMCDETVWTHQTAALRELAHIRIAVNGARDSLVDMAQAIIAQAPPRFAIAGHSMGGRIALEVIRKVPERVSALALLDTGYAPIARGEAGDREAAGRFALLDLARREGMRVMGAQWARGMVHPARLGDEPLMNAILDMIERKTPELYEAQIKALLARPDAGPVLGTVRCPTLVLCGEDDSWAGVGRHQEMSAAIRGSTLRVIPECGHMATMERPEAVSEALAQWLKQAATSSL